MKRSGSCITTASEAEVALLKNEFFGGIENGGGYAIKKAAQGMASPAASGSSETVF
jgi:hypothetical protein